MITISFAVFLHTSSLVFLPTALFAYLNFRKEPEFSAINIVRLISIFIVFALFSLFAVYISGYPFSKLLSDLTADSHILPLFSDDHTYGIFSAAHLIDIINLLFLTAPIIVVLPTILLKLPRAGFTPELKFLGASSLLALFFISIVKSDLGMARDWDLFALAAFPITIFSVTALIKIYDKTVYRVALPLFIICIVHTLPWIFLNSSDILSVDRAEQLAESSHWSGHSKAILYDAVANEYFKNAKPEKALELSIKAYNNEHDDRFLFNIANGYSNLNQQDSAIKYFEILNKSEFKKELTLRNLSRLYMLKADYINARKTLEELYNLLPDDMGILFNLGAAFFESEDYGRAIEVFTTILKSKTDHYEAAVKLGESYFNNGQYPQVLL
jgi:tetratricopeptide (TPR) repeat protein